MISPNDTRINPPSVSSSTSRTPSNHPPNGFSAGDSLPRGPSKSEAMISPSTAIEASPSPDSTEAMSLHSISVFDEVKRVEYREICNNHGFCILKIVPIPYEIGVTLAPKIDDSVKIRDSPPAHQQSIMSSHLAKAPPTKGLLLTSSSKLRSLTNRVDTRSTIHPDTGSTIHPDTGSTIHPDTGSTIHPDTGSTTRTDTGSTTRTDTGSTTRLDVNLPEPKAPPREPARVKPKPQVSSRPTTRPAIKFKLRHPPEMAPSAEGATGGKAETERERLSRIQKLLETVKPET